MMRWIAFAEENNKNVRLFLKRVAADTSMVFELSLKAENKRPRWVLLIEKKAFQRVMAETIEAAFPKSRSSMR